MSILAQTERCLGPFSTNPTTFTKEFKYLTHSYDLSSSLTPGKKKRICKQLRAMLMPSIDRRYQPTQLVLTWSPKLTQDGAVRAILQGAGFILI